MNALRYNLIVQFLQRRGRSSADSNEVVLSTGRVSSQFAVDVLASGLSDTDASFITRPGIVLH